MNGKTTTTNTTRIKTFDAVKLFAIFLVLWGHVIQHLQGYAFDIYDNIIFRFIYSFHMPLFMAVSGYFGSRISNINFKDHFQKKVHQLIVPALTFGILFCISWRYIAGGGRILDNYIWCYWFLKSAFCCSIMYAISAKTPHGIGYIITIIISQFLFMYRLNIMYPCFLIGVLMNKKSYIVTKNCWTIFILSITAYLICFHFNDFTTASHPLLRLHRFIFCPPMTIITELGLHFYKLAMGIAGAVTIISLFIGLGKLLPRTRIGDMLCGWGAFTLGIYLLQAILLEHALMKTVDLRTMDWTIFNLIVSPAIAFGLLLGCVVIVKALRKSKYVRKYMLGEKS